MIALRPNNYILDFSQLSSADARQAGGKGASLGELTRAGFPVPPGFVVSAEAFLRFLAAADLTAEINAQLKSVDPNSTAQLETTSQKIQLAILSADIPPEITQAVLSAFDKLGATFVAVRSSATAEDSSAAAWAGQLETFINTERPDLLKNIKKCWASLFLPRAIFYRLEKGCGIGQIAVAVVVQAMVQSEKAGVAFSVHPVSQNPGQLLIEAVGEMGEAIVAGRVTPDQYVVSKFPPRITEKIKRAPQPLLPDATILQLAEIILQIEKHYGFPVDVEWAFEKGRIFITQARPITTLGKTPEPLSKNAQPNIQAVTAVFRRYADDLVIFNYPCLVFYACLTWYWETGQAQKYFGATVPFFLFFIKSGAGFLACPWYLGVGEAGMHQLEKDPATWLTINSPQAAAAEKCFSDWLAANPVKPNQTLTHYLALLKNAGKNLIDNNLFFQLSTQIDRPLNQKLLEVLRAAGSNLSEQEIFSMCLSPEPADVEKHERLLADLRRLAEQQKLNLNPENFEANLKNAEFSAKLRECYCHGYFLRSGYGGVVLWSMKDEYQLLLAPAGPRTSPNPIFAKPSADLSHLSPEPQLWIKLAQHFSHLRDRRKTMQQKAFYHMAQILEEIGKLANRSRADLENLRIEEFDEKFITSPAATKLINQRKAGYLGFWSPNSGTWEWDGQTAQQNYQLLAKKPQPTAELKGSCACPGVARGPVRIVLNPRLQHDFIEGEILVTGMTSPDFVPLMKKAAAVITELGGITCHAAIISRELNKPCVIGALGATQVLKDGEWVEVEAGKGLVKKLS